MNFELGLWIINLLIAILLAFGGAAVVMHAILNLQDWLKGRRQ